MGLSTLYQLRGRGTKQSNCLCLFDVSSRQILTEVSEKRLEAIKGFTELGSGFKLLCEIYRSVEQGISLELLNLVSSIQLVLKCILNC